jgi:uracil-DNA glycosylase
MVGRLSELPAGDLGPAELLTPGFLLDEESPLRTYWVPFERLNPTARIVIVGLTPGWSQMKEAFTAARDALQEGLSDDTVLAYVDQQASFAGSMRSNMVKMLDAVDLPAALGIASCADLFAHQDTLVHTTSALRYPVFVDGKNYGGQNPQVRRSPLLIRYVREQLAPELEAVPDALILPLGKAVEDYLRLLIEGGELDDVRCLFGFPHPSGANGHRARQFEQNRPMLRNEVARWASSSG